MRINNQTEILELILKSFVQTCESVFIERGNKRPNSLKDIEPETLVAIKNAFFDAIQRGISGEIEKNISLEEYTPFSDAIASEIAGKINIKIQCVIKAGNRQLEEQIHFIETKRPYYKQLYPAFLGEMKFNKNKNNYNYVCLMENLVDYTSFHDMIFKSENEDKKRIAKAIDFIFDVLSEMYHKEFSDKAKPRLDTLYLDERIIKRLDIGRKRFNTSVMFPSNHKYVFKDFDELLEKKIQLNDEELYSFKNCLSLINDKLDYVTPDFITLVHGDAHPANLMINLNNLLNPIKFLDPNVYIQNSDYLYDMGKMIHWLDIFGFIALERVISKKIISVTPKNLNGSIKVDYKFDTEYPNFNRICDLKNFSLEYTYKKIEALADNFKDNKWQQRLNLSISSAYVGGLAYVDQPSHFLICFLEALRYLNKFLYSDY